MIKEPKNKAVGITSYCDTEEKLSVLIINISQLRSFFPEYDIVLHSNYPLDGRIQKLVDTYIYEDLNHVDQDKYIYYWNIITDGQEGSKPYFNRKFFYSILDSGFSVFQQIKALTDHLINYERVMLINYDTQVDKIRKEDYNLDYDLIAHYFPGRVAYSLIMLDYDPKKFKKVTDAFSFDNWWDRKRNEQLNEERFYDMVQESGISVFAHDYKVPDLIGNEPDYLRKNAPLNSFFTNYLLYPHDNIIEFYLWGLTKPITHIEVITNLGDRYLLTNKNDNPDEAFNSITNIKGESFGMVSLVRVNDYKLDSPIPLKVKKGYRTEPI